MTHIQRNDEIKTLLVKAADGELSDEERKRLDVLAQSDPSLAAELEKMAGLKRTLEGYGLRDPNPLDWREFESTLRSKSERRLGWLLMLAGFALVLGAGLFELFADPKAPLAVKCGVGALVAGLAILLFYVGRGFFKEYKKDPYKDVIR